MTLALQQGENRLRQRGVPFLRMNTMNASEHADCQLYLIFDFYNILVINALIEGLQEGFTV